MFSTEQFGRQDFESTNFLKTDRQKLLSTFNATDFTDLVARIFNFMSTLKTTNSKTYPYKIHLQFESQKLEY